MDVSVVLPCFREPPELVDSIERIEAVLRRLDRSWEIIAVEDGGGDGTLERLRSLEARPGSRLRVIAHPRNTGRGGAVRDGILAALGEFVGFLDVDLEVGPHYILPLLAALEGGADVATIDRTYVLRPHPRFLVRHMMSSGYRRLQRHLLQIPVKDSEAGFKFFRRSAVLPLLPLVASEGWFWDTEILWSAQRHGLRFAEVPALFHWRPAWPSTVRLGPTIAEYLAGVWRLRSAKGP